MTDKIHNVLIIDYKAQLEDTITFLKKNLPLQYKVAKKREDTYHYLESIPFSVIIVNFEMPAADGMELAEQIKGSSLNKAIPLIFVSDFHDNELPIFQQFKSAIIDHFVRPVNGQLLINRINVYLRLEIQKQELLTAKEELKVSTTALKSNYYYLNIRHKIDYLASLEKGQDFIFENILNSIFEIDWVDSGGIYLMDEIKKDLTLVCHKGLTKRFVEESKYYPKESAQVKLVLKKKPYYNLYNILSNELGIQTNENNLISIAVIPILYKQKVIGALNIASKSRTEITDLDKKGIESLSSSIGSLIAYARIHDKLKAANKELALKFEQRTSGLKKANVKLEEEYKFHKQTKVALAEAEYKYKSIFENTQQGIVLYNATTLKPVDLNHKVYEDLGYTKQEFMKLSADEFTIYNSPEERDNIIKELFAKGKKIYQVRHKTKDGNLLYREISASIITLDEIKYILGTIHDITGLIQKNEELRVNKEKYKALHNNVPIGLFTSDMNGRMQYANTALVEMLGFDSLEELMNCPAHQHYARKSDRNRIMNELKTHGFIRNMELQIRRKDGTLLWGKTSVKVVDNNETDVIQFDGVLEDISEMKKIQMNLEEAHKEIKIINKGLKKKIKDALSEQNHQQQFILQKSKIESLGELAAGIAHEINQPLGVMSLSMQNLQLKITSNQTTPEYLHKKFESINSNIGRIKKIVDHIRTFSYDSDSVAIEKVNINLAINNALLLIGTQYRNYNIEIKLELQEDIGFSIGDKLKFEQVILNLLSNAKFAIEEKALAETDDHYKKEIKIVTLGKDDSIYVLVEDNGIGIKPNNLIRVFEPFYTSKPVGIGTGLGLSIVYGIIKEMNGEISIDSKSKMYTKVKIILPRFPENV